MTMTMKGALAAAGAALIWVQWGFVAMLFVVVAAIGGAIAAGTLSGEVDVADRVRDLQDRT